MVERRVELHMFQFVCPDCGMSDTELGHLAGADDIHCIVCLVDDERYVRLRRWIAEEATAG
jgi:chlorite dismutase